MARRPVVRGFGPEFQLGDAVSHEHRTPWDSVQSLIYARFSRVLAEAPILSGKDAAAPSVCSPLTVVTEAKRQKRLSTMQLSAAGSICRSEPCSCACRQGVLTRRRDSGVGRRELDDRRAVSRDSGGCGERGARGDPRRGDGVGRLYAFAAARNATVLCFAHVTNTMGGGDREFDKGHDDGVAESLAAIRAVVGVHGPIGRPDRAEPVPAADHHQAAFRVPLLYV